MKFSWADSINLDSLPAYMMPAYQEIFANYDEASARILRIDSETGIMYLPILVKRLEEGSLEAYSAYGYGGIVGKYSLTDNDLKNLKFFLASNGIQAVFLRHSPFLDNQQLWPQKVIEKNRSTFAVKLKMNQDIDQYCKSIPQKLRWSVNYARKAGLQAKFYKPLDCFEEKISDFYKLYLNLMIEKKTLDYYKFSNDFFLSHVKKLDNFFEFSEIIDPLTGELLVGAFFLMDKMGWVHYHLSASSKSAMKMQAMELLLASAISRYGDLGFHSLHLGGGHAIDESDGLSRFKAKFADLKLEFYNSKIICDENRYWTARKRLPLKNPAYFLISEARA